MRYSGNKTEAQKEAAQATRFAVYNSRHGGRVVLEGKMIDDQLVVSGFYGGQTPLKVFKTKGLAVAFADKSA